MVCVGRLYLLDVGLSLCAMPCLGLCITTTLWAVPGGRVIGGGLGHVAEKGGRGKGMYGCYGRVG
jgi:hypothetical protein